jgi:DNA-binding transcriptional LysR family regulator
VSPRLPQRIAGHFGKLATHSRVDRDTGDLTPNLLVDNFSLALKTVLGGDAVGLAPLVALEGELRAKRIALLTFTAPWLHLSYGLFYTRKRALSRVAQLFMTQLRRIEADIQAREQRALLRLEAPKRRGRKTAARRKAADEPSVAVLAESPPAATRPRRSRKPRR